MHPIMKTGVGLFAAGALVLASAMPANANVRRFSDPNDTKSGIDIHWVQVDNSSFRHRVIVTVGIDHFPKTKQDRLDVYFDTRGSNAGPEYHLAFLQDFGLFRVSGWSDHGTYVKPRCSYIASRDGSNRYVVAMKRGCLSRPGKVRVAVRTGISGRKAHDWAKAPEVFLPWVRR
jgi:hypothetical protein